MLTPPAERLYTGAIYVRYAATTWVIPVRQGLAVDGPTWLLPGADRPAEQVWDAGLRRMRAVDSDTRRWWLSGEVSPQRSPQYPGMPAYRWRVDHPVVAAWRHYVLAGKHPDGRWWVDATDRGGTWIWPDEAHAARDVAARMLADPPAFGGGALLPATFAAVGELLAAGRWERADGSTQVGPWRWTRVIPVFDPDDPRSPRDQADQWSPPVGG